MPVTLSLLFNLPEVVIYASNQEEKAATKNYL
jgi:hypothetical protein